ncbi:hypothetical protein HRI_000905000 [Hibiscus trionum]|uniref:NAC domain-containing protein n=1 Tax=Hibiscus trionum TaxID=183268 RepID=A0A9W7H877_HIBTR|nr:hypothetical protein HRI_000905000 [Hibiscus trionum]
MEIEKIFSSNNNEEEDEDILLPGFRFHPTDEELVGFYLKRKVEKKLFIVDLIKHVDIYKYDPWDLSKVSKVGSSVGEKEWYFFCRRGRKYKNSVRPNRVTVSGFWKATGIDRPIYAAHCIIGLKKTLVYYKGSGGKGTKTDWMMHEFRLPANQNNFQQAEVWTLCRIFKREASCRKQKNSNNASKQNNSPISCSRACSTAEEESKISVDDERKLLNDHFHEENQLFPTQVKSFSNPNNDNEFFPQQQRDNELYCVW